MEELAPPEGFWTDGRFKIAAYVGTGLAVLVGLSLRFDYELTLPAKPPPPPAAEPGDLARMDSNPEFYKQYLLDDAKLYGVEPPTPEDMGKVFAYEQRNEPRIMKPGEQIETGTLRVSLRTEKKDRTMGSEGTASFDHLILTIENLTDVPVAYRVVTTPNVSADRCAEKADLPANGIALPPRGKAERTECIFLKGMKLRIDTIEAIRLPPLSFHYVSRLSPLHVGVEWRLARAHRVPAGKPCQNVPDRAIDALMQNGQATWRDVIDFYARHDCERYKFLPGYRAFTRPNQLGLPVTEQAVQGGP